MAHSLPRLAALLFARLELPGWYKVMRLAHVTREFDHEWRDAPMRTLRGKRHGYLMKLNLAHQLERRVFFLGRFQGLEIVYALQHAVRPADTVIDVGANCGMVTLGASRLVGPSGDVWAFEPNPKEADRIRRMLQMNQIANVNVLQLALGDEDVAMTLSVRGGSSQTGTLATGVSDVSDTFEVAVRRGDGVLPATLGGPVSIKIDVEGFECRVLRGLRALIDRLHPFIITEANDEALQAGGDTAQDQFDIMHSHGYRGYAMGTRRQLLRHRLTLKVLRSAADLAEIRRLSGFPWLNIAWIAADSIFEKRFAPTSRADSL